MWFSRLKTGRRSGKRLAVPYLRQGKCLFIIKFQPPFALCVTIELAREPHTLSPLYQSLLLGFFFWGLPIWKFPALIVRNAVIWQDVFSFTVTCF